MIKKLITKLKTLNTSTAILLAIGVFMVLFIITMIIIFCIKGAVPDTLIQYTLGAGGVEAILLAAIKISKVATGSQLSNDDESEENYYE